MTRRKKEKIASIVLALLGLGIGVIGILGGIAPPVITGLGFLVLAWVLSDAGTGE